MNRDEAESFLRQSGWLSTLPIALQDDWLQGARLVEVTKGDQMFAIQDDPRFMFGLAKGTFGALLSYHPQETKLMMLYGAGNWAGDAAVLSGNAHRGTAVARTECTCLAVPSTHIEAVATRHPDIWRWMAQNVLFQLDTFITQTEGALYRDPICRLITMMLSLCKLNPRQSSFELSTEEIGQMVGLTRNTVSKGLQILTKDGLISRRYRTLEIQSPTDLKTELDRRTAR
ncbi:MAG: Crp/Fnr family transcriptional regulator [Paracoccaceae bacterium]